VIAKALQVFGLMWVVAIVHTWWAGLLFGLLVASWLLAALRLVVRPRRSR
jgi:hypothetical protein